MVEGRGPKGWAVRPLKRHASWVQNVESLRLLRVISGCKLAISVKPDLRCTERAEGNTEGRPAVMHDARNPRVCRGIPRRRREHHLPARSTYGLRLWFSDPRERVLLPEYTSPSRSGVAQTAARLRI